MHLGQRIVAFVTYVFHFVTLSPFEHDNRPQHALAPWSDSVQPATVDVDYDNHGSNRMPLPTASLVKPIATVKAAPLTAEPVVGVAAAGDLDRGPIFHPDGSPAKDGFMCDYSAMKGWTNCSSRDDRSCWLKRPIGNGQYEKLDIFTDYEKIAPNGTVRNYAIDLVGGNYTADGMLFAAGKFFVHEGKLFEGDYPGPWIQACWGDT